MAFLFHQKSYCVFPKESTLAEIIKCQAFFLLFINLFMLILWQYLGLQVFELHLGTLKRLLSNAFQNKDIFAVCATHFFLELWLCAKFSLTFIFDFSFGCI